MRRIVALVVLLTLVPSSGSAEGPTSPRSTPDAPWVRMEGKQAIPPAEALRRAIATGKTEMHEVMRLRREQLTAPAARGGSGMYGLPVDVEAATADHEEPTIVRYPLFAADFAGDEHDELVTLEMPSSVTLDWSSLLSSDYPATVVVRRGSDGEEVSSFATDAWALFGSADLDGDGKHELIELRDRTVGVGGTALVVGGAGVLIDQTVSAYSGSTGEALWSQNYKAAFAYAFGWGLVSLALVEGVTNLIDQLVVTSDSSGDGKPDIFVGTFDLAGALAVAVISWNFTAALRYTATTVAGATGETFASFSEVGAYQVLCALVCVDLERLPYAIPMGDVSGDGDADVLLFTGAAYGMETRSVDGETTHWTTSERVYPFGTQIVELNGSGPADILNYEGAFDGATGGLLFVPQGWDVFVIGDADGDTGSDILEVSYDWDFETDTDSITLTARAGSDGSVIWTAPLQKPEVEPGQWGSVFLCYCLADLDGDGTRDLLVASQIEEESEDEWSEIVSLSVSGISGASGTTIFTTHGLKSYGELPVPFGDHNGNGTHDLVAGGSVPGRGYPIVRVSEGSTGAHLFSVNLDSAGWTYSSTGVAADLTGGSADELAMGVFDESTDEEAYWWNYTTQVFDGPDLKWKK